MLGEHSQERGCLAILLGWTKAAQEMVGGRRSQPWQGQQEHVMGMAPGPAGQRHPRQALPGGVPKEPLYSFLQPLPVRSIPGKANRAKGPMCPKSPAR